VRSFFHQRLRPAACCLQPRCLAVGAPTSHPLTIVPAATSRVVSEATCA